LTTSLADIRTAWNAKVWTDPTILAITTNIFPYEVTKESAAELAVLFTGTQINFFTYVVNRELQLGISNQRTLLYSVEVSYYVEQFAKSLTSTMAINNQTAAIDAMVAVDNLVFSALLPRWNNTVLYFEPQRGPCRITSLVIDSRPVYRASYTYTGYVREQLS
jgi:hypothetical protein